MGGSEAEEEEARMTATLTSAVELALGQGGGVKVWMVERWGWEGW